MKEIAVLGVTDRKRIILSVGEYRGEERIDLRQSVLIDKDWVITRKGISFSTEWVDKFIEMIEKLKDI
ncbi:hypothetical protein ES708_22612 [subsurface metagenome]